MRLRGAVAGRQAGRGRESVGLGIRVVQEGSPHGVARVEISQPTQLLERLAQLVELRTELATELITCPVRELPDLPNRAAHPGRGGRKPLGTEDEQPGHDQYEDLAPADAVEHETIVRAPYVRRANTM